MPTRAFQLNINFVPISPRFRCIGAAADCPPADLHTLRTFDAKKHAKSSPNLLMSLIFVEPIHREAPGCAIGRVVVSFGASIDIKVYPAPVALTIELALGFG